MPAGESFHRLTNLGVLYRSELGLEPAFEECEMVVALRQESVVLEQTAQMLDASVGWFRVGALVGQGSAAGGDSSEEVLDGLRAYAGENTLGAVSGSECVDELIHHGLIEGPAVQQQGIEVVAQGATCADSEPVVLGLLLAACTGQYGDVCAGRADGGGAVPLAWQQTFVTTGFTYPVAAHCVVEADASDGAFWPADTDLGGLAVATSTFVLATGAGSATDGVAGVDLNRHQG